MFRQYGATTLWAQILLLIMCGLLVNGPYSIITTAVSSDLVSPIGNRTLGLVQIVGNGRRAEVITMYILIARVNNEERVLNVHSPIGNTLGKVT